MTQTRKTMPELKEEIIGLTRIAYDSSFDAAHDYLAVIRQAVSPPAQKDLFRIVVCMHETVKPTSGKKASRISKNQKAERDQIVSMLSTTVDAWSQAALLTNPTLNDFVDDMWRNISRQTQHAKIALGLVLRTPVIPYKQLPHKLLEGVKSETVYDGARVDILNHIATLRRLQGLVSRISTEQYALAVARTIKKIRDETELCAFVMDLLMTTGSYDDSVVPDI